MVWNWCDGPRNNRPGEEELCKLARKAADIDWPCEVKTRFLEHNLGCRQAVSSHIDWFFSQVDEGIIIEDDCLPSVDFFRFAAEMLDRYRDDDRIMHIAGANFQNGIKRGSGDWFFSHIPHIWGWASWRRAWKKYDVEMRDFPEVAGSEQLRHALPENPFFRWKLMQMFRKTFEHSPHFDTWDCQWHYAVAKNNGYAINPNYNLVANIGGSSSHQISGSLCRIPFGELPQELTTPDRIYCDRCAEAYTGRQCYRTTWKDLAKWLISMVGITW